MNEASSVIDTRDRLLAPYFDALQGGEARDAVRDRLAAEHPDAVLLAEFDELAAMLGQLGGVAPAGGPPDLPPLPDFHILREVGRGGMGVVYEAEQISLNRRVALKVNAGNLSGLQQLRFLREQHILARLHHTHIVPIHTSGLVDPWRYFAMAYIEGAALHHVIRAALRRKVTRPHESLPPLSELAGAESRARSDRSTRLDMATCVNGPQNLCANSAGVVGPGVGVPALAGSAPAKAGTPTPDNRPAPPAASAPREVEAALDPARPLTLSAAYFRSVAGVVADAADALQHAHDAGVFHRDVKPSNIMVDGQGQCWIIDFGLAGVPAGSRDFTHPAQPPGLEPCTATGAGVMGTPQYMAPEQYDGRADARSDVWGLGCTLYELLTLRPTFDRRTNEEIARQVRQDEPPASEQLVRDVPRDLAAICRKALRKEPGQRYQTAGEFAADLRRWLNDEPTVARPAWMPRRAWLWSKRNKWRAAAILLSTVGVVLGVLAVMLTLSNAAADAKAAAADADAKRARAQQEAQERDYDVRLLQAQRTRFGLPIGWSRDRLKLIEDHYKGRSDEAKRKGRDEAAATLAGLDANTDKELKEHYAGSLAFSKDGKRLVLGGVSRFSGAPPVRGGVYDREADRMISSEVPSEPGEGPVAFAADGTPLQLVATSAYKLRLWDVDHQRAVREFTFAEKLPEVKLDADNQPAMALSADGTLVAASARLPDGKDMLVIWEAATGKEVARAAGRAEVMAFSPDRAVLATADKAGDITVRLLGQFDKGQLLPGDRLPVHCLAFTRDPVRRHKDGREASGWLLAAGEGGGGITIWDVARKMPRTQCLGSIFDVYGVAFSPDGTLLASVGRGAPRLWDVATGRLLLTLTARTYATDVAFSPDGQFLAASGLTMFGQPGGVDVYSLDYGRGIQTLRGLRGQVVLDCRSPDGRYLAALSHDWQLGVWDLKTGRLLHIFEAPVGLFADNSAIALSADNRLVCASLREAKIWDVVTGKELHDPWPLPPGLVSQLAFHPSGKLLLFRTETEDMKRPPDSGAPPDKHPRVCRVRDMLAKDPEKPLFTLSDFNWHVFNAACPADGSCFVVDGVRGTAEKREHRFAVFDGRTGKLLWDYKYENRTGASPAQLDIDATGKLLAFLPLDESMKTVVELTTGGVRGSIPRVSDLGPGAAWWLTEPPRDASGQPLGSRLHRAGEESPLITLGADALGQSVSQRFNAAGTHLAWGSADGTVMVYDIQEVRRRLAAVGLGW